MCQFRIKVGVDEIRVGAECRDTGDVLQLLTLDEGYADLYVGLPGCGLEQISSGYRWPMNYLEALAEEN